MSSSIFLRYFRIMLIGYGIWIALYFFVGWIGETRGPAFNAALPLDSSIPFLPAFQPIYLLCYIIVLGVFFISLEPAFLNRAYITLIMANTLAFIIFALVPVLGPPREHFVPDGSALHSLVALVYFVDSRYNAFPSLHVANPWIVAFLAVYWKKYSLLSGIFVVIAVLISIATLFVKQHYIIDVLGGFLLAVLIFAVSFRLKISEKSW